MESPAGNKVIAHFRDGTLVKGTTLDFFATKVKFHIEDIDGEMHEIWIADLKAVFFVKDFEGNPDYDDRKGFYSPRAQGKKVVVEFIDGEVVFGYTMSYSRKDLGFFLFPGDPDCNNAKIFIVHEATRQVKVHALPSALATM